MDRFKHLDWRGKILLVKVYFDQGMSLLNYPTKALMVLGFGAFMSGYSLRFVVYASIFYAIFCYILGWAFIKYKWVDRLNEILNIVNPFQRDVRKSLKIRKVYK